MAEQKNVKPEELLVPLDPNGSSETAFLCVNGKNLLVKRGESVAVPAAFAEVCAALTVWPPAFFALAYSFLMARFCCQRE